MGFVGVIVICIVYIYEFKLGISYEYIFRNIFNWMFK